jgi:alkylation response protein AidB-like acyl-CoA dehydrogenase
VSGAAADPADRMRELLAGLAEPRRRDVRHGDGDDTLVGSALRTHGHDAADMDRARAFARALFDAGLGWLRGPVELGGSGLAREEIQAVREVMAGFRLPDLSPLLVGQHILAPAIEVHGTDEQRRRWLPALWRGDAVGCQLFSEPGAGSDLGSLRTRAERVEGGWLVSGQKVWSSGAHLSDLGELLVRTDPATAGRTQGLSVMVLDMRSPGVTVRPIPQMNGSAHFCEVFLDDVLVPDADVLGPVGQGWAVANTSLSSERDNFGDESVALFLRLVERLLVLGVERGAWADDGLADAMGDAWARQFALGALPDVLAEADRSTAGVAASIVKLVATDADRRVALTAADVLGPAAVVDLGGWGEFAWSRVLLGMHAPRIAGGTDEVQLDIVATRGLGLPRDPKIRA